MPEHLSSQPLQAILDSDQATPDAATLDVVRSAAYHRAFHGVIRGLAHRINNHLQGVRYGVPFLIGEETDSPPSPDRLQALVGDGTRGTLEAVELLSAVLALPRASHSPTDTTQLATECTAWINHSQAMGQVHLAPSSGLPAIHAPRQDAAVCLVLLSGCCLGETEGSMHLAVRSVEDACTFGARGSLPIDEAGLDLRISTWLAEQHGGSVEPAHDEAGAGFDLTFPAV